MSISVKLNIPREKVHITLFQFELASQFDTSTSLT